MKFEEMRRIANGKKVRKKPDDEEHRIQCECIRAFRYKYPGMVHNLLQFLMAESEIRLLQGSSKLKALWQEYLI